MAAALGRDIDLILHSGKNRNSNQIPRTFSCMQERAEKHFNKGVDFVKRGEHEKAISSFDKALAIEPDNDMVWVLRGSLLDDLGRYADSLISYDKALAIKPDYSVAWCGRGIALRKLGRYTDAVASFDRALHFNPTYADAKKHREQAAREEDTKRTGTR